MIYFVMIFFRDEKNLLSLPPKPTTARRGVQSFCKRRKRGRPAIIESTNTEDIEELHQVRVDDFVVWIEFYSFSLHGGAEPANPTDCVCCCTAPRAVQGWLRLRPNNQPAILHGFHRDEKKFRAKGVAKGDSARPGRCREGARRVQG